MRRDRGIDLLIGTCFLGPVDAAGGLFFLLYVETDENMQSSP